MTQQKKLNFVQLEDRLTPSFGNPTWAELGPSPYLDTFNNLVYPSPIGQSAGAANDIDILPTDPKVAVLADTGGGVWRTTNFTDASPTWTSITSKAPYLFMSDAAFDPLDKTGNTVYGSLGQFGSFGTTPRARFATGTGAGYYKITDALGANPTVTLTASATFSGQRIHEFLPTAINAPGQVLMAAADMGLYRSTDGGTTWAAVANGLTPGSAVTDIRPDPLDANTFYAANLGNGIFRSTDAGATWTKLATLNDVIDAKAVQLGIHHSDIGGVDTLAVYALVVRQDGSVAIFRYTPQSNAWTAMAPPSAKLDGGNNVPIVLDGEYLGGLVASPTDPNVIFAGGSRHMVGNAALPLDQQWTLLVGNATNKTGAHEDVRSLRLDAAGNLISTNDGGVYRLSNPSDPATRKWSSADGNLATVQAYVVDWDSVSHRYIAGLQDNGVVIQTTAGQPGGFIRAGGDGAVVRVDNTSTPGQSTSYFSAQEWGDLTRHTYDAAGGFVTGKVLELKVPVADKTISQIAKPSFFQEYSLNAVNPKRILAGVGKFVFESFDQGDTFTQIDIGLSGTDTFIDATASGGKKNGVANSEVAYVIGHDKNQGVVYRRGPTGGFVKTNWANGIFHTGNGPQGDIAVDPDDYDRVYVVNEKQEIWRTVDGGANWENLTKNLIKFDGTGAIDLAQSMVAGISGAITLAPRTTAGGDEVVFVSGYASDTLYAAGNGSGVFGLDLSDANPQWAQFGQSLPRVFVHDLQYNAQDNILVAGTLGRGLWAVTPLSDSLGNLAPVVDLNGAPAGFNFAATFTQGKGAISIVDPTATITGTTSANLSSATVYISNYRTQSADTLTVDITGTAITSSYKDGFLTLTGVDTKANYLQVLQSLKFNNTEAAPNTTDRTVRFRFFDGTTYSNEAISTVSVVASNLAPIVDLNGPAAGTDTTTKFTEGGAAVNIALPVATLTDADSPNLASAKVVITNPLDNNNESLVATVTGTAITAAFEQATFTLTLTGNDTPANYEKVLRTIQYSNTATNPKLTARVIQVTASDGANTSATAISTVTIAPANNAPVLDTTRKFTLKALTANPVANGGTLVFDMLESVGDPNAVTDPDKGDTRGIAITAIDTANGTWEFSDDGGTKWESLSAVKETNARLLTDSADHFVRFVPNAGFNGTATISFRAWDGSGRLGLEPDEERSTIPNGGRTPFSTAVATATITVGAPPAPPAPVDPVVNFTVTAENQSEGRTTPVVVTIQLDKPAPQDLFIQVNFSGTAIVNDPAAPAAPPQVFDYTVENFQVAPFSVFIAAGQTTGTFSITILDDTLVEPTETAIITIDPATNGVTIGAKNVYTLSIIDNDVPPADTIAPTAVIGSAPAVGDANKGATAYDFTVTYADNVAIDATSFDANDIRVTGPNGFNAPAEFIQANAAGNGTPRTVTYRINTPTGGWATTANGTYTLALQGSQIFDTSKNAVAANATLGTFTVNITPPPPPPPPPADTTAPTAALGSAPAVADANKGAATYDFTVTYADNVALDATSFDGNDVRVTGPNGFSALAAFVQADTAGNGTPRTATYRLTTPTGGWASTNNGTYTIALQGSQVVDTSKNAVAANASLGTFTVNITPPPKPVLIGATQFAVGADNTGNGTVQFFNADKSPRFIDPLTPFPGFTGGVRVAAGDVNGDGVADIVVGTGPGRATQVKVYDGVTNTELWTFDPFEATFTGGIYVATGDVNGDGRADIAITPDQGGGPRIRLFSGNGFTQMADFFGIDDTNFRGGARAALGDITGDGKADVVVAAGFGGGPRVATFNGAKVTEEGTLADQNSARWNSWKPFGDFLTFEEGLRNGAFIAIGDVNGDGFGEIVGGGGPGGGPRVTAFSGKDLLNGQQNPIANFFGGDVNNRGGVRVAVKNLDGDTKADVVVGSGTGGGSKVTGYSATSLLSGTPQSLFDFDAIAGFTGGVFVG